MPVRSRYPPVVSVSSAMSTTCASPASSSRAEIGANLHVSWIDPRKTRLMTVVGDRQMAIYNDVSVDQKLWIVDAGVARSGDFGGYESLGDFQWRTRAGDIRIPRIDMSEPLRNEIQAFGTAIRTGERPTHRCCARCRRRSRPRGHRPFGVDGRSARWRSNGDRPPDGDCLDDAS